MQAVFQALDAFRRVPVFFGLFDLPFQFRLELPGGRYFVAQCIFQMLQVLYAVIGQSFDMLAHGVELAGGDVEMAEVRALERGPRAPFPRHVGGQVMRDEVEPLRVTGQRGVLFRRRVAESRV